MSFKKRQRSLIIDLMIVGFSSVAALALRENLNLSEARWRDFLP